MHRVLVTLTALSTGCSLFGTPCPQRVEAMRERLAAQQSVAAEVDPWALVAGDPGPVPLGALARVDLPYAPSPATRAVTIDATGGRYVDGAAIELGRAPLCAALAIAGAEGGRVRVHAAATARATAVLELLADLHSCKAYNLDLVAIRKVPPWVERVGPTTPMPADCPVDRAAVAAAATPAERSVALADALLTAHGDCGCPVDDRSVLATWQAEALPTTFVTSFAVRPSPSAEPFDVTRHEPWQDAAERLIAFAGPDPLSKPLLVWFANEGSLAPTDEAPIHIDPP